MTIKAKLYLIFLFLAALPLAVTGCFSYMNSVLTVKRITAERARSTALFIERSSSWDIEGICANMQILAGYQEFGNLDDLGTAVKVESGDDLSALPFELKQYTERIFLGTSHSVSEVIFLDGDGEPVVKVERAFSDSSIGIGYLISRRFFSTDRTGFESALKADSTGGPVVSRTGTVWRKGYPLYSADGRVRGVCLADFRLAPLFDKHSAGAGEAGVTVVDSGDVVIYHTDIVNRGLNINTVHPEMAPLLEKCRKNGRSDSEFVLNGKSGILSMKEAACSDWCIGVFVPFSSSMAAVHRAGLINLSFVFISIILIWLLILLFTRGMNRSLGELMRGAAAVSEGDMESRIAVDSKDELGLLAEKFNGMAESLARTREELIKTERLAVMGEISAGMAHELKNPLHSILLSAQTLRKKKEDGEAVEKLVGYIEEEIGRMSRYVSDFVSVGKSGSREKPLCSLNDIINEALRIVFIGKVKKQGIAVVRDFVGEYSLYVDREQILHMFINLFLNAAQAMPRSGALTVGVEQRKGNLEIKVADTGTGIEAEIREHIFVPYFSNKEGGTGLGLSIVERAVRSHGGSITVESEPGKGTVFTILLPSGGDIEENTSDSRR